MRSNQHPRKREEGTDGMKREEDDSIAKKEGSDAMKEEESNIAASYLEHIQPYSRHNAAVSMNADETGDLQHIVTPSNEISAPQPPTSDEPASVSSRPKHKGRWTKEEDEEMIKGFRLHGVNWGRIAKDPSLRLGGRKASGIRERFRKYKGPLYRDNDSQVVTSFGKERNATALPATYEYGSRLDTSASGQSADGEAEEE